MNVWVSTFTDFLIFDFSGCLLLRVSSSRCLVKSDIGDMHYWYNPYPYSISCSWEILLIIFP